MSENILTQIIFLKCLNFEWEDLEQTFLFSIFFLVDTWKRFCCQKVLQK